jgi:phosphoenolpyruvate synthase/pyruvate phosphate dikinase
MGKVCVAGAGAIQIDYAKGTLTCAGQTLREGDAISINGSTGEVFAGAIKTADSELKQVLIAQTMKPADSEVFQYYDFIMKLADKHRTLGIRTNADTPEQVRHAIAFGDFQRGYLIVDRAGVRVLRDPYSAKPYVLFYTTKRVGGGVQNFDAIKVMKFAAS